MNISENSLFIFEQILSLDFIFFKLFLGTLKSLTYIHFDLILDLVYQLAVHFFDRLSFFEFLEIFLNKIYKLILRDRMRVIFIEVLENFENFILFQLISDLLHQLNKSSKIDLGIGTSEKLVDECFYFVHAFLRNSNHKLFKSHIQHVNVLFFEKRF